MTSETDYSIRRTVGAREIPGLRPASDQQQQRRGRKRRKHTPPDGTDEEAVQVELTDERIETGDVPADEQDGAADGPAVDCLA
ncbi:MAG: hypothetical protein WBF17_13365 [Phycisphaerae bacterium]